MKISTIFFAIIAFVCIVFATVSCPQEYCKDGIHYMECTYSMSNYKCHCTTTIGCLYGCNAEGTTCAAQPQHDPRCPDQCYEGVLHYKGWWSEEHQVCMSYTTTCPYGCLPDHSACSPAPSITPSPAATPEPSPTIAETPTPSPIISSTKIPPTATPAPTSSPTSISTPLTNATPIQPYGPAHSTSRATLCPLAMLTLTFAFALVRIFS